MGFYVNSHREPGGQSQRNEGLETSRVFLKKYSATKTPALALGRGLGCILSRAGGPSAAPVWGEEAAAGRNPGIRRRVTEGRPQRLHHCGHRLPRPRAPRLKQACLWASAISPPTPIKAAGRNTRSRRKFPNFRLTSYELPSLAPDTHPVIPHY